MITRESPRLRTERGRAVRAGVRVEQLTIGWMTVEAIVALTAGLLARSVLLTAFGIDSVIELVTGACCCGACLPRRGAAPWRAWSGPRTAPPG